MKNKLNSFIHGVFSRSRLKRSMRSITRSGMISLLSLILAYKSYGMSRKTFDDVEIILKNINHDDSISLDESKASLLKVLDDLDIEVNDSINSHDFDHAIKVLEIYSIAAQSTQLSELKERIDVLLNLVKTCKANYDVLKNVDVFIDGGRISISFSVVEPRSGVESVVRNSLRTKANLKAHDILMAYIKSNLRSIDFTSHGLSELIVNGHIDTYSFSRGTTDGRFVKGESMNCVFKVDRVVLDGLDLTHKIIDSLM